MMRYLGAFAMAAPLLVAVAGRAGVGPKNGRHPENVQSRQPGEHVDPRRSDVRRRGADDGRVQQSGRVRSAGEAKQPRLDRARSWPPPGHGTRTGPSLTLPLRQGVSWHDGKPFMAKDVQCTFDMLTGKSSEKLRVNPRKSWWRNLEAVHHQWRLRSHLPLKRPQPTFLTALAGGYSPIYPCHIKPRDMRQRPIGTGPFKFVSNSSRTNGSRWRETRITGKRAGLISMASSIRSYATQSTATLAFVAGKFDMTFLYSLEVPLLRDVKSQMPQAICELVPLGISRSLIVNRDVPPFDNPDLRQAMALSLDRVAFINIITEGQGDIGGAMQPPPEGLWGMPPEMRAMQEIG